MPRALTRLDRQEAYDAGIRAAAAHLLDGAPKPRSPFGGPVRSRYFNLGARTFDAALRPVLERWP